MQHFSNKDKCSYFAPIYSNYLSLLIGYFFTYNFWKQQKTFIWKLLEHIAYTLTIWSCWRTGWEFQSFYLLNAFLNVLCYIYFCLKHNRERGISLLTVPSDCQTIFWTILWSQHKWHSCQNVFVSLQAVEMCLSELVWQRNIIYRQIYQIRTFTK